MNQAEPLSIIHLIADASLLVQAVMGVLILASIVSWALIIRRGLYQANAGRSFSNFEQRFWSGGDFAQLYREPVADGEDGVEQIFRAGFKEFSRLRQQSGTDRDAIMEVTARAMRVALTREREKLEGHLSFLASVASVSPYIGLFGTVWGIMNSFRNHANAQQATLAAVAPGISEALVATAMGLFAAIPAVIAYNRFAARADQLGTHYQTFAEEFTSILHRQLHAG